MFIIMNKHESRKVVEVAIVGARATSTGLTLNTNTVFASYTNSEGEQRSINGIVIKDKSLPFFKESVGIPKVFTKRQVVKLFNDVEKDIVVNVTVTEYKSGETYEYSVNNEVKTWTSKQDYTSVELVSLEDIRNNDEVKLAIHDYDVKVGQKVMEALAIEEAKRELAAEQEILDDYAAKLKRKAANRKALRDSVKPESKDVPNEDVPIGANDLKDNKAE
jgi:hypothetical protein